MIFGISTTRDILKIVSNLTRLTVPEIMFKLQIMLLPILGCVTERNCCKFPQGKQIQGNLTAFIERVIFSVVYVLFINLFKLLVFTN